MYLIFLACAAKQVAPESAKPFVSPINNELENQALGSTKIVLDDIIITPDTEPPKSDRSAEVQKLLDALSRLEQYEYTADDEQNAQYLVKQKYPDFQKLTGDAYKVVKAQRDYSEVSAGIYVAGAAELRFSEMVTNYPTPATLDHNAQIVFGERVRDLVVDLAKGGRVKLDKLLDHSDNTNMSGEFTYQALAVLQRRFPWDYPIVPVMSSEQPGEPEQQLRTFFQFRSFDERAVLYPDASWSVPYEQQQALSKHLSNGNQLRDSIQQECGQIASAFELLDSRSQAHCELQAMIDIDRLIAIYPNTLPSTIAATQQVIQDELGQWKQRELSSSEFPQSQFWNQRGLQLLKGYQLSRIESARKSGGAVSAPPVIELSPQWKAKAEEEMSSEQRSTLENHTINFERELRILRWDIRNEGRTDRPTRLRLLFASAPQQLHSLERRMLAVLVAFPEQPSMRLHYRLSLGAAFVELQQALVQLGSEEPELLVSANTLAELFSHPAKALLAVDSNQVEMEEAAPINDE